MTLPLAVLDCDARTAQTLQAIGAKSVADLMALPRDGIARRGGQSLLDTVDRALGRLPASLTFPGFGGRDASASRAGIIAQLPTVGRCYSPPGANIGANHVRIRPPGYPPINALRK